MTKLLSRKNWYKKKVGSKKVEGQNGGEKYMPNSTRSKCERDESEPETVIFVPSTPRGELVKRMRESDMQFRKGSKIRKIKFIERAGVSLKDTLVSSNPRGKVNVGEQLASSAKVRKVGSRTV